jgi:hypothetical protein
MRVSADTAQHVVKTRKPGYLPSRFKPGYWINDIEARFEQWLYDQGYRLGEATPTLESPNLVKPGQLMANEINPFASYVTNEQWLQVCVFASTLENLYKS